MNKFIIEIHDKINPQDALALCGAVISGGMVSGHGSATGKQYCYHTRFRGGESISVFKRKSGTQKFVVRKDK